LRGLNKNFIIDESIYHAFAVHKKKITYNVHGELKTKIIEREIPIIPCD
jgi:hypothetical protein